MRAREFLYEDDGSGDTSGYSGSGGSHNQSSGKLHKDHESAIVGMQTFPEMPSWYYDMYRFGVHMAGSPGNQNMAPRGPLGNQFTTLAYTDADQQIIDKSKKEMGIKGKTLTSRDSKEPDYINKVSTTAKKKKNRYGV